MNEKELFLYNLLTSNDSLGMSEEELLKQLPKDWTKHEMMEILNQMAANFNVEFLNYNGKLIFAARKEELATKLQSLDEKERIVYLFIKDAGNKGTWLKHIKEKSGLHSKNVTEAINKLEKRGFIRNIKPVKNPTRKVYLLSELEPSVELTGGSWYTDNQMDEAYIDTLTNLIQKYIDSKTKPKSVAIYPSNFIPPTSISEIHVWISKSGLSAQELSLEDIGTLVNRLVYGGLIYQMEGQDCYMSTTKGFQTSEGVGNAYTDSPCGTCPVFNVCTIDGLVSPLSCEYLAEWLA